MQVIRKEKSEEVRSTSEIPAGIVFEGIPVFPDTYPYPLQTYLKLSGGQIINLSGGGPCSPTVIKFMNYREYPDARLVFE